MNEPQKAKWDPILDKTILPPDKVSKTIVNRAYLDNLPNVRKLIDEERRKDAQAFRSIKDIIIH